MPSKPENVEGYLQAGCGRCKLGGTPDCKVNRWAAELALLRGLLLGADLGEEIKWGSPCYTHGGRNILMLGALKDCAVVSFFRGAELDDPEGLLEKPGENSRFARYLRFRDAESVAEREGALRRLVSAAVDLEGSGKRAAPSDDGTLPVPAELALAFHGDPEYETAFATLTPGRRRGYLLHFNSAKQSKTRSARIAKCRPKILAGKGWNER